MKDLVDKIDRAKRLLAPVLAAGGDIRPADQKERDATELLMIGVDLVGELIANSRRAAVALEAIAAKDAGSASNLASAKPGFRSLADGAP